MKKITVDTNVLVSATFWSGASHKIIEKVEEKKLTLILSPAIIKEYAEVLEYDEIQEKIKHKNLEMKMTVQKIVALSTIGEPTEEIQMVEDDPDDDAILECAVEGNIDFIISQDKHLLKLKEFRRIPILKPEDFLTKV